MGQEEEKTGRAEGSERECLRCGSLIPLEDDEGLCPTCGTEYGRATIAMPALEKPIDFGVRPSDEQASLATPVVNLANPASVSVKAKKSNTLLWVVAVVFIVLALATASVAAMLLLKTRVTPEPAPPAIESSEAGGQAPAGTPSP